LVLALHIAATAITFAIGLYSFNRRAVPGARSFSLATFAVAAWILCLSLRLVLPGLGAKIFLSELSWAGFLASPAFVLRFAREFSAEANLPFGWRQALLLAPALAFPAILLATGGPSPLGLDFDLALMGGWESLEYRPGPAFLLANTWALLLVAWAAAILLGKTLRSPRLKRPQTILVLVGILLPALAGILAVAGIRTAGLRDDWPYGFLAGDLVIIVALTKFGIFRMSTAMRATVIEVMRDMVVVTDDRGIIRDYNPAARQLPGTGRIGMALAEVLPSLAAVDSAAWSAPGAFIEITEHDPEERWLEVSRSPLEGHRRPERNWHVYLFRDITRRKLIELELAAASERLRDQTISLKKAQAELVRSEKMAALGQLMAGIAHEMNSPLGAIKSSIESCAGFLPTVVAGAAGLGAMAALSEGRLGTAIIERAAAPGGGSHPVTTAEERAAEKEAALRLQSFGMDPAEAAEAARWVAQSGVLPFLDLAEPYVAEGKGLAAIKAAAGVSSMASCLEVMKVSVEKISKVVRSLRSVSTGHSDGLSLDLDLAESVRGALSSLSPAARKGIRLVTRLEPGILVHGHPEDLGQVWSNLLLNAVQAIHARHATDGQGQLEIEVARVGDKAVVQVTDNGEGIPEALRHRIFEPFFTTKKAGEGSGLGLDIAKRSVTNHGGSIAFESRPGKTSFKVALPISGCES
jgi:signal transduction histidine kinase